MQLKRRRIQWDVETLLNKVKRGEIEVPRFQRGKVWSRKKKSEAIYSLLTIGLPDIILVEKSPGRYILLDGLQRVGAVEDFIKGEYKISLDPKLGHIDKALEEELNNKRFEELSDELKSRLLGAELGALVYSGVEDFEIAKEIFTRINYKPTPLSPAELLFVLTYDREKTPLLKEVGDKLSPKRFKGFSIVARILAGYTLLKEGLNEKHFSFSRFYDWMHHWLERTLSQHSTERIEELATDAVEFSKLLEGEGISVVKAPYWSEFVSFLLKDAEEKGLTPSEYWEQHGRQKLERLRKDKRWIAQVAQKNRQKPAVLKERFFLISEHFGG